MRKQKGTDYENLKLDVAMLRDGNNQRLDNVEKLLNGHTLSSILGRIENLEKQNENRKMQINNLEMQIKGLEGTREPRKKRGKLQWQIARDINVGEYYVAKNTAQAGSIAQQGRDHGVGCFISKEVNGEGRVYRLPE